ncbi:MAG: Gfo/Idh/MocA family protein [Anaerolineae bacterium]
MATNRRFAIFGAGFWSRFQLAAWQELESVQCVAIYNRTPAKAENLARQFAVPAIYDDPEELLRRERPDFVDVITSPETHGRFVRLAAEHGIAVICQKPMAPSLTEAEEMVATCARAGVPFFVHENWRWQTSIRALKQILDVGTIGAPFRARLDFCYSFPVFDNQPFLKELEQFILTDMGSHILDVARFLFGEASSLYCRTRRIHQDIKGEDVATVMLAMASGVTVLCNLSYATRREGERFPETYVFVEGEKGSLELAPDFWVRVTTATGTEARRYPPPSYPWADPAYAVVHASIVACNANLLGALRGKGRAETTGEDNLHTMRLVFAAYRSAASDAVVKLS